MCVYIYVSCRLLHDCATSRDGPELLSGARSKPAVPVRHPGRVLGVSSC